MKRLLALLPLPLALLVRLWARHTPETVERLFSQGVYPALAAPVSRAAALCPVPVFGLGVLALLGYILWSRGRDGGFACWRYWGWRLRCSQAAGA